MNNGLELNNSSLDIFKARLERITLEGYARAGGSDCERCLNTIKEFLEARLNGIQNSNRNVRC